MSFKSVLLIPTLIFASVASQAAITENTYRNNEEYYVWGALGFANTGAYYINEGDGSTRSQPLSGLLGLGGDFEYMMDYDFGLVASARYYAASEDIDAVSGDDEKFSLSVFSIGASARFHFPVKYWNFYFGPGLSFTSAGADYDEDKSEASLTISPTLTMGVMISLTEGISIGVENHRIIGLGSELNGTIIDDYLIKGRFSL